MGQVGDLHVLLCWRCPGPVPSLGVTALLRLHARPDALPAPQDQRHAVTDGLGHDLEIVLVEEARVDLQGSTHSARAPAREPPPLETTPTYRRTFPTRTGTQELSGVRFFLTKTSIPDALKNPGCHGQDLNTHWLKVSTTKHPLRRASLMADGFPSFFFLFQETKQEK